jgi:hypothetical protein
MFALGPADYSAGVLDCGGGPASFTAELAAAGFRAKSVDPLYALSGSEIQTRFEAAVEPLMNQVRATPDEWVWTFHRDIDDLCANRRAALGKFLEDFPSGLREQRYIQGGLPCLPFGSHSFGLALSSHLLFLYSDTLSEDFHVRSILELCRVAAEVRVFPLLTLSREPSPHVTAVRAAVEAKGWSSEIVRVNYELQRGGNQMLRIFHRQAAAREG